MPNVPAAPPEAPATDTGATQSEQSE
jgi:hypothetical protein